MSGGRVSEGVTPLDVLRAVLDPVRLAVLGAAAQGEVLSSVGWSLPRDHPGLGEPAEGPWTEDEALILGRFFAGDRLVDIPKGASKRKLVLEKIAQEFEPGERCAERDVN